MSSSSLSTSPPPTTPQLSRDEYLMSRIVHPYDANPSTEDIFSAALETLFTDDTQQSHGVPGQSIVYRSPRFGDVYLEVPAHPDRESGRLLFAHYLWNAAILTAEGIEKASSNDLGKDEGDDGTGEEGKVSDMVERKDEETRERKWNRRFWDMRGMDVLEVGAATALPSLLSALSNARSVICTDHPSSPAITSDAIANNISINVISRKVDVEDSNGVEKNYVKGRLPKLYHPPVDTKAEVTVGGYVWGTQTFFDPRGFGKPMAKQPALKSFDRIIIADCLWMPSQHMNLVKTVLMYLKERDNETVRTVPCALVVAGFHTGRNVVRDFIEVATGTSTGHRETVSSATTQEGREANYGKDAVDDVEAKLRAVEIFESSIDGRRRPWEPERPLESREQSRRWCVCAVLTRGDQSGRSSQRLGQDDLIDL